MTMWVFGYGSLLWNPGFPVARREVAVLHGYARSFCMSSIHHRGSEEKPGLVLALDAVEGAHCKGIALAVEGGHEEQTLADLRERELISSAYLERDLEVELGDGSMVTAVTYVIDPHHVQYCGGLSLEEQAQIIAHAVGGRGPNTEYLYNTAEHLAEIGLHDSDLDWLAGRVREITA
ncbi:gamma-glutamylcyclotransferase [Leisingera aquaemixtae]|uniref:gamma-glutamylcyclotransferase n=1 Tax=Leisingera aquaemixtae TaxID=1396826 RepID=UPI001C97273E|nr:gamma-glutamylcyclotransferase [Leisingera aquaemixtae]MBY6066717.1 gamma-glutamylcyclotransferase [Leisingera aquaemixtae]